MQSYYGSIAYIFPIAASERLGMTGMEKVNQKNRNARGGLGQPGHWGERQMLCPTSLFKERRGRERERKRPGQGIIAFPTFEHCWVQNDI